jgi:hypothetical protein
VVAATGNSRSDVTTAALFDESATAAVALAPTDGATPFMEARSSTLPSSR